MAITGNRSPSPTSNSKPNLISRNSELNNTSPMRKSFSSSPFQRPLRNGPPDSPSRNYLTKEEKENDADQHILKQAKTRSPSVPKATNHFMIPTISAVSKINPSPRKKVLGDRNEPTRTSLSFSEEKSPFSLSECDKKPVKVQTPFNPNVSPKVSKIAPLDADPSLPPYDPKTNFLSPRPQFLHYRPNPRLEHYYQEQGSGVKNLEDSFLYENSSSDNEVSEGSEVDSSQRESEDSSSAEGIIEHSQKEAEVVSSKEVIYNRNEQEFSKPEPTPTPIKDNESNDKSELKHSQNEVEDVSFVEDIHENSQIEIEDSSSVEVVNCKDDLEVLETDPTLALTSESSEISEGPELENFKRESKDTSFVDNVSKDGPKFSEPEPIMPPHILKEISNEKREVKLRLFSRGKFIPLLLFLLFACFWVSSIDNAPVYEVLTSSKFYEERFNGFARNIKIWSDYSTLYVNELISSFTRVEEFGPVQFFNLTYVQDPFIGMTRVEEIYVPDEVETVFENEDEFERLLDENLEDGNQNIEHEHDFDIVCEDGNQNIEHEHDFDIVCDLPKGVDFEEKLGAESLELSPKEAVSEVVEDHAYSTKTSEEDSENEFSTTIPNFKNTLELNLEEVVAEIVDHVCNSEISETMINERGHLVSDSEIVSSFENTLREGISQVDSEIPLVSDSEIEPIKVESVIENSLQINDSTSDLMPDYESANLYKTLAISLLVLALIAAPILIHMKNNNRKAHNSTTLLDPMSKNKTMKSDTCPQSYSPESEMSSSIDGSYSYSEGYTWGITNEAHSKERKQKRVSKRESLASSGFSVSDSPSYGSFTTYERLSKHGFGDDEVVTPVRRSSRIKKIQVASP